MMNVEASAQIAAKMTDKILKLLEKTDDATALATINYCFTKMIIERLDDPLLMKAALVTFLVNTSQSIDELIVEEMVH